MSNKTLAQTSRKRLRKQETTGKKRQKVANRTSHHSIEDKLFDAILHDDLDEAEWFLKQGAKPSTRPEAVLNAFCDMNAPEATELMCRYDHKVAAVPGLLNFMVELDIDNDLIIKMIDLGASVDDISSYIVSFDRVSVLDIARINRNDELVYILLNRGVTVTQSTKDWIKVADLDDLTISEANIYRAIFNHLEEKNKEDAAFLQSVKAARRHLVPWTANAFGDQRSIVICDEENDEKNDQDELVSKRRTHT